MVPLAQMMEVIGLKNASFNNRFLKYLSNLIHLSNLNINNAKILHLHAIYLLIHCTIIISRITSNAKVTYMATTMKDKVNIVHNTFVFKNS